MKTLKQLALVLGITPDSLRQRIARGTLKAIKIGRDWVIEDDEIQKVFGVQSSRESK